MGSAGYTRIPGSATLSTQKRGSSAIEPVLSAERASLARIAVDVDGRALTVGRAVLQGRSIPLLVDVVDRVAPLLEPEEFTVYLHLYRLAVADDKNVCRVSRAELSRRTRLADRRLGKAIAGLVTKGHVVLLDRDRDGTSYRVLLPDESLDDAASSLLPTPTTTSRPQGAVVATAGQPPVRTEAKSPPTLARDDVAAAPGRRNPSPAPRSVGDVCAWFAAVHGRGAGRTGADVAAVVLELLEDGHTFARIPELLDDFVARSPRSMPLRDLPRLIGTADATGRRRDD